MRKLLPAVIFALALSACGQEKPEAWEHGYKTSNVISTRYKNKSIGQNIGFKFPNNPNDSDRMELDDFMTEHGGLVFQSGGYPDAEMFVKFKGVEDSDAANKKLQDILPQLDNLVRGLRK